MTKPQTRTSSFLIPSQIIQMLDTIQSTRPQFTRSEIIRAILDYWVPKMLDAQKESKIKPEEVVQEVTTFNFGPLFKEVFKHNAEFGFTSKSHMFLAMMYSQLWTNPELDFSKLMKEKEESKTLKKRLAVKVVTKILRINENAVDIDGVIYVKANIPQEEEVQDGIIFGGH